MTAARSLLLTLTGRDRPGVSSVLFETLAGFDVAILDVEQVTIHGRLTLATLITAPMSAAGTATEVELRDEVSRLCKELGMEVDITATTSDESQSTETAHVTLIGSPLLPIALAHVAGAIASCGANIDRIRRMATTPVTAIELDVSGSEIETLKSVVTRAALSHGVDIAVQRGGLARRAKRLVVMDVDSTLIQNEVIDLLAAHGGVSDAVTRITEAAMHGEMDFASALSARVSLLAGLPQTVIKDVQSSLRLTPGARSLILTLTRLDHHVGLVSGGFIEVIEPLVKELGVSLVRANSLEIQDGRLTGRLVGPIVDRKGKAQALHEFAQQTHTPLEQTVAIGDGANDLDMIALAGLGVAFNAKQIVKDSADTSITAPYLDSVLYLLGIPREYAVKE